MEVTKNLSSFQGRNTNSSSSYVSEMPSERRGSEYFGETLRALENAKIGDSKLLEKFGSAKAELKGLECRSKGLCKAVNEAKSNIDKLQVC